MSRRIIAFDHHWQTPAITEYHSYQQLLKHHWDVQGYAYVAFPWATLIDLLQTGQEIPASLEEGFETIIAECRKARCTNRLLTVCQHVYAQRYSTLFKACHLDIIYWSHTTIHGKFSDSIEWRPFPLYPVQSYSAPRDGSTKAIESRKYVASFIGAYEAKYYLSSIREEIFKLSMQPAEARLLIIKRDKWHFQQDVYDQQIFGQKLEHTQRKQLDTNATEYRESLMESMFSLCPSGSGPNSIRLWESLTYGSIPFVFADTLSLPGEQQLWIDACVFMPEASNHMSIAEELIYQGQKKPSELRSKQEACKTLESHYGINIFIWDLLQLEGNMLLATHQTRHGEQDSIRTFKKEIESKLIIVDPGLKSLGSHHHKINSQLSFSLGQKNVLVLSHKEFDMAGHNFPYGVKPLFSYSPYDDQPDISSEEYCRQVNTLTMELTQALRELGSSQWLYIHTASAAQVQTVANTIELLDRRDQPRGTYLQLMFEPRSFSSTQKGCERPRSTARYTAALKALHTICHNRGVELTLETSNPIFQEVFSGLIPEAAIGIHPHLFRHSISEDQSINPPCPPYRLLIHSGDPRPGKGLEWIASRIETWIQQTKTNIQYVLHIGRLRYPQSHPEIAQAIAKIDRLINSYPDQIHIINGYLDDQQWAALAASSHAIALLHDPDIYQFKTSANLWDYLEITQGNRLILVTSQTNSTDHLRRYEINHNEIVYGDDSSLLEAILKIGDSAENLPNKSEGWRRFYNDYFASDNIQHLQQVIQNK